MSIHHNAPADRFEAWPQLLALARPPPAAAPGALSPPADATGLLDLYLPVCSRPALTVAHLGQSLDGRIATDNGASVYVTGPENLTHLHRMRALCDAVIVGASTVRHDDPRLTTRRVSGPNPVRVVLDPRGRLAGHYRLFNDGAATTLWVCADGARCAGRAGRAEVLQVAADDSGALRLPALIDLLHRRGLRRLFVEGGGVTVSRFLAQGLLDRLHVAVAPVIIGSGRRHGLTLPPIDDLSQALRPRSRCFPMGRDMLFDLQLRR